MNVIPAQLNKRDRGSWQNALASLNISSVDDPYGFLLSHAPRLVEEYMPADLLQGISLIEQASTRPYHVLRNLPVDPQLRGVPTNGRRPPWKETWVSEAVLISLAIALGLQPFSYLQEKDGALVHEIAPITGQERQLSNSGRVGLGFHTDHSILHCHYRPEFLMLLGLINPDRIPTLIACIDDALKRLDCHHEEVLRQSRYRTELPDSVLVWNGKKLLSEWRPLLTTGCNGKPEFSGNLHSVKCMDDEATSALTAFVEALSEVTQEVVLEPGTLVLFDNHRVLHARRSVSKDRWLQRLFCRHSLVNLRQVTDAKTSSSYTFDMCPLLLE